MSEETYLGDGLYASFDGWHFWLRAPRLEGDHRVALEPNVYLAFRRYADQIIKAGTEGIGDAMNDRLATTPETP